MATNRAGIYIISAAFLTSLLCLTGCAELNLFDTPEQVLNNPLGTDPIKRGMSKEEVISIWGNPDQMNRLDSSDEWQTLKEEWVYVGRYSKIPLNKSYLFKTRYLIFDGNNLVSIGNESQRKAVKSEKLNL